MNIRKLAVVVFLLSLAGCGSETASTESPSDTSSITTQPASQSESEPRFKEGVHYQRIARLSPSHEPQVIKFISFNCPACRFFETTSKLSVAENVTLERFPVSFSRDVWRQSAQAYATLRALNVHDELSMALFQAIQDKREPIGDKQYFANWVAERTTSTPEEVIAAYDHEKVADLLAMYKAAERRFAISSVPSLYVNGNIYINIQAMEGESQLDKMLFLNELVDYLISQHGNA